MFLHTSPQGLNIFGECFAPYSAADYGSLLDPRLKHCDFRWASDITKDLPREVVQGRSVLCEQGTRQHNQATPTIVAPAGFGSAQAAQQQQGTVRELLRHHHVWEHPLRCFLHTSHTGV